MSRFALVTLAVGFAVSGCEKAEADVQKQKPPEPVLTASGAERVYVTNEVGGSVSVIDSAEDRVIATIPVGKRPRGVRISPDGKTLYVALSGSPRGGPHVDESKLPPPDRSADGIGVVDLESARLVRVLTSGPDPESFDLTPDGKELLVSNEDAAKSSLIDVATGKARAVVAIGEEPEGVAIRPDGKIGYVTSESDHRIDVVDLESSKLLTSIPTVQRPRSVVFTRDGSRAFVSGELGKAVDVIDSEKHQALERIALKAPDPVLPMGLVLSPDERTLWVTTGRGQSVVAIDVANAKQLVRIDRVGKRPWGIGITRDGKKIYTANGPSNDVTVIDVEAKSVLERIPAGASPWGIAVR